MIVIKMIFWLAVFVIFWGNIGYSASILIIGKLSKKNIIKKFREDYEPTVTLMIVAHNEEKVIKEKLQNAISLDYPLEKFEILVSSDNSTDKTNEIVREFIEKNSDKRIRLYEVKERKGKTNAQNEAQKTINSEILVMTDANSILDKKAIKELVSAFYDESISYVTGRLEYTNAKDNNVSKSENTYWNLDTRIRDIESRIQTITAGNGALYACRNSEYHDFDPIKCHDSAMPVYYALRGKRAIANHKAIAYEKAGEVIEDEFKRKIRMNRIILTAILPDIRILNIFKYKWFSYFYLGHRTCRYVLWLMHIILLLASILLFRSSYIYGLALVVQLLVYAIAVLKQVANINNRFVNIIYYYCITIVAQIIGVKNILTGKAKPFWEKAESTR